MQDLTDGQEKVKVEGSTIRRVVDNLEATYPGLKDRLSEEGRIRPNIAVIVDGQVSRLGLLQTVSDTSEVHFLPAIGGGAPPLLPLPT